MVTTNAEAESTSAMNSESERAREVQKTRKGSKAEEKGLRVEMSLGREKGSEELSWVTELFWFWWDLWWRKENMGKHGLGFGVLGKEGEGDLD